MSYIEVLNEYKLCEKDILGEIEKAYATIPLYRPILKLDIRNLIKTIKRPIIPKNIYTLIFIEEKILLIKDVANLLARKGICDLREMTEDIYNKIIVLIELEKQELKRKKEVK